MELGREVQVEDWRYVRGCWGRDRGNISRRANEAEVDHVNLLDLQIWQNSVKPSIEGVYLRGSDGGGDGVV